MTHWLPLLPITRHGLRLLAGVVLGTTLLLLAGTHTVNNLRTAHQQLQDRLRHLQDNQQRAEAEQAFLMRHRATFEQLADQGLLQPPAREQWLNQLLAAHQQQELPATLNYRWATTQPLPRLDNNTTTTHSVWIHDLEFSLQNIHEEDLLHLLDQLTQSIREPFRIQGCQLSDPQAEGLQAQCTLRFFSLLPKTSETP
ncbi:MAG: hypothetical protein KUL75_02510 [Sterolibacterium sp.]|nr:hypothetical protein [Sterolibacterium sp.]